jgi:hypothetical protein
MKNSHDNLYRAATFGSLDFLHLTRMLANGELISFSRADDDTLNFAKDFKPSAASSSHCAPSETISRASTISTVSSPGKDVLSDSCPSSPSQTSVNSELTSIPHPWIITPDFPWQNSGIANAQKGALHCRRKGRSIHGNPIRLFGDSVRIPGLQEPTCGKGGPFFHYDTPRA